MKQFLVLSLLIGATFVSSTAMALSVRIYNGDSQTYKWTAKCNGSSKSGEIKSSTTSTYTFHSTATECDVTINGHTESMSSGDKYKIKNGNLSKN